MGGFLASIIVSGLVLLSLVARVSDSYIGSPFGRPKTRDIFLATPQAVVAPIPPHTDCQQTAAAE